MAYATTGDLQSRWRTLPADQLAKAELILADVERDIRRDFPDVDSRAAGDADLTLELSRIVCNVTRRRMTGEDFENVEQVSDTSGPYGRSRTFRAPQGSGIELTAQERRILAGTASAVGPAVASWSNEP